MTTIIPGASNNTVESPHLHDQTKKQLENHVLMMNVSNKEHLNSCNNNKNNHDDRSGGWVTSPFILGSMMGMTLASGGWFFNLTSFLVQHFNMTTIDATRVNNITNTCNNFFPVVAAILADSVFGAFPIITAASCISLLGMIMLTLTIAAPSLNLLPCSIDVSCQSSSPTMFQHAFLYASLAMNSIGIGGTRYLLCTLGIDQFKKARQRRKFIDRFFLTMYVGWIIGNTLLVYVEENSSWTLGFGLSLAANTAAIALFLCGKRFYLLSSSSSSSSSTPEINPFVSIVRVLVAASICKMRRGGGRPCGGEDCEYYYENPKLNSLETELPSPSLRFLNRAAEIQNNKNDDIEHGTNKEIISSRSSWRLCSVEEVEDLKKLIKLAPIWPTGILFGTCLAITNHIITLQSQSITINESNHHFHFPISRAFTVIRYAFVAVTLSSLQGFVFPLWKRLYGRPVKPLQRNGVGHLCNLISMICFAVIKATRRHRYQNHSDNSSFPWLMILPIGVLGIGEAFHFAGVVTLHYQEFPRSLKNTSTSMVSLNVGTAFYLGNVIVDGVRRLTGWLPVAKEGISELRMKVDSLYWMLAVLGFLNFVYFVSYAKYYRYNNLKVDDESNSSSVFPAAASGEV